MTISVAKEANVLAGDNGTCSDGGSGKDKCGGGERVRIRDWIKCRDSSKKRSFCNGSRLG